MNKEEILSALNEIFVDILDNDEIELDYETTPDDVEEWDSLEQINIVMACEKKWNIKFEMTDIASIKKVGNMVDLIAAKLS